MQANVKQFFKDNPTAPIVYQVGKQLFMPSSLGSAKSHAERVGATVELIKNPNIKAAVKKTRSRKAASTKPVVTGGASNAAAATEDISKLENPK